MAKKEEQITLPGITGTVTTNQFYRVTFNYQGPNYQLRAGSLIIPASNIETARLIANGTLKNLHGDKWFNVTKIVTQTEEAPF